MDNFLNDNFGLIILGLVAALVVVVVSMLRQQRWFGFAMITMALIAGWGYLYSSMEGSVLEQSAAFFGLALLMLAIAVVALIWLIASQERRGERATSTYNNIRAGSWVTVGTLVLGVIATITVAALVSDALSYFLIAANHGRSPNARAALAMKILVLIVSLAASFYFIFLKGLFEIPPGAKAYLRILGIPFGRLGAGYGWALPLLMQLTEVRTQAFQESSDGREEYVTGNGVEVRIASGVTGVIQDPLLSKGIIGGDIEAYVSAQRKAALRRYIAERSVNVTLAPDQETDLREVETFYNQMKEVKGEIAANGPETVRGYINEQICTFGLFATQVELEEILFSDTLEKKAERFFDEMMESLGLVQDVVNKTEVMKKLNEESLKIYGVKEDELTHEERLDLMRRGMAFSLSAEGQGNYTFVDFGGNASKKRVIVPVGNPSQPANSNSKPKKDGDDNG